MNGSLVRGGSGAVLLAIALTLTGSPSFSHFHTDPRVLEMRQRGMLDWKTGAVHQAAETYKQAYRLAKSEGDAHSTTLLLNNIGGMDLAMLNYKDAINTFLEARILAEREHDSDNLAIIGFNLASLYIELGEGQAADRAAEQAMAALGSRDPDHLRCLLLGILGKVRAHQGRSQEAVKYFHQAIALTSKQDERALARAWHSMGEAQLDAGDLTEAEKSLREALRIRIGSHDPYLAITYERLGELKLARHDPNCAAELLARGTSLPRDAESPLWPIWPIYLLRGRILLAQGHPKDALSWFLKSIEAANEWREEVAPSDALQSSADTSVRHVGEAYSYFVETSLSLHSDPAVEAFIATEENRAASLRKMLTTAQGWRKRLSPEYLQTLLSLRGALFEQFAHNTEQSRVASGKFQQKLMDLEATAGLYPLSTGSIKTIERTGAGIALRDIQRSLTQEETLLSFYAGNQTSALWAVTDRHIELHLLPSGSILSAAARRFRQAVENGSSERDRLGEALYEQFFKDLTPAAESRPFWLIAAADDLFDIPLAALVAARKEGKPVYLIEKHATQRIPSALMLRSASAQLSNGPFIGVADGIYNVADPRWTPTRRRLFGQNLPGTTVKPSLELTRLVGSAEEIKACARKWAGDRPPILLTGRQASRKSFESALRARPAVIHLAAHVLNRPDKPEDALIDLGLSPESEPEVLSSDDIANFEVPGAIVVMNGCASAGFHAVSGKGVMGLTRAWIKAGAQTVIGTRWPIPDDTGELFQLFYSYWKNNRGRSTPRRLAAESLQRAQLAVLDTHTWRSDPKYWSAFYVVGKE